MKRDDRRYLLSYNVLYIICGSKILVQGVKTAGFTGVYLNDKYILYSFHFERTPQTPKDTIIFLYNLPSEYFGDKHYLRREKAPTITESL
jgi:hypothetical protein